MYDQPVVLYSAQKRAALRIEDAVVGQGNLVQLMKNTLSMSSSTGRNQWDPGTSVYCPEWSGLKWSSYRGADKKINLSDHKHTVRDVMITGVMVNHGKIPDGEGYHKF